MKRYRWTGFTCVIALAIVASACWRAASAADASSPQRQPFEGKVLLIYGAKPEQSGAIVNVRIEKLGSIDFLAGSYIDEPEYQWKRNLVVYIKLDQVNSMIVYDSVAEYQRTKSPTLTAPPQK